MRLNSRVAKLPKAGGRTATESHRAFGGVKVTEGGGNTKPRNMQSRAALLCSFAGAGADGQTNHPSGGRVRPTPRETRESCTAFTIISTTCVSTAHKADNYTLLLSLRSALIGPGTTNRSAAHLCVCETRPIAWARGTGKKGLHPCDSQEPATTNSCIILIKQT